MPCETNPGTFPAKQLEDTQYKESTRYAYDSECSRRSDQEKAFS